MWPWSSEPDGYWDERESPVYRCDLVYCSPQFSAPDRVIESYRAVFEYRVAAGANRGCVVHVGGYGADWPILSKRHAMREAIDKSRRFYGAAQAAMKAWPEEVLRRVEAEKRADDLAAYARYEAQQRHIAETALAAFTIQLTKIATRMVAEIESGRIVSLAPWTEAVGRLQHPGLSLNLKAHAVSDIQYKIEHALRERQWTIEEALAESRKRRLSASIPLVGRAAGIVFGTDVETGEDIVKQVADLPHILCSGSTGSGKSVFVHQLVWQLARSPDVEKIFIVDLKGGVGFYRYRTLPTVEIVFEFPDVIKLFDRLVSLLDDRQTEMREGGIESWGGKRIFVFVDEYAEIEDEIKEADDKEAKQQAKRLGNNIKRLARRARSMGIVLAFALQKPTADSMSSAVRTNLNLRICLRPGSRLMAASMLDDLDDLPVDPLTMPAGRYIYFDASRGETRYMQTHKAPGVKFQGES